MAISNTRLELRFPYDKARMLPMVLTVLMLLPGWIMAEDENRPFNVGDHFN